MHYFYWTHNVPVPPDIDGRLFVRILWGDARHVWDQYYPDETWRSWLLWEGPLVTLYLLSVPVMLVLLVVLAVLLWLTEQVTI